MSSPGLFCAEILFNKKDIEMVRTTFKTILIQEIDNAELLFILKNIKETEANEFANDILGFGIISDEYNYSYIEKSLSEFSNLIQENYNLLNLVQFEAELTTMDTPASEIFYAGVNPLTKEKKSLGWEESYSKFSFEIVTKTNFKIIEKPIYNNFYDFIFNKAIDYDD